jgi:hypothetical protein
MRALAISMLLALPMRCFAAAETSTSFDNSQVNPPLESIALDSPAQAAVRKLKAPEERVRPTKVASAEIAHPDLVTRLEEIRVYGRNEPEDYVGRKISPLMQFRARMEHDRPTTPWEKIRLPLCLIGLCGNYGPEGIPLGDSPEQRAEDRLSRTTLQSNGQFYGTLQ